MKLGKTKIIFSSLCLVAALALAIFTVYAWFTYIDKAKAGGIETSVTSYDVISFKIDYYYASSEDGEEFIIGEQINPSLVNKTMKAFTPPLANETRTAILLDLKLIFAQPGDYALTAKTTHAGAYNDVNANGTIEFNEYTNYNYLSNAIYFRHISESNIQPYEKFTLETNATEYNFITHDGENTYFDGDDDDAKKNTSVDMLPYSVAEGTTDGREHHIYYVMDYMTLQIDSMYSIMLQLYSGSASLSTQIQFRQDIIFDISKKS